MKTLQKIDQPQGQTSISLQSTLSLMQTINSLLPDGTASVNMNAMVKFMDVQSGMTIEKAISGTQIAELRKESKPELLKAVSTLITTTAMSLNITNTVNSFQVYEAAELICKEFWFLRLEELILVFRNIKTGVYGKDYNRLDVSTISQCIRMYDAGESKMAVMERKIADQKSKELQSEGAWVRELGEKERAELSKIYESILKEIPEEKPKRMNTVVNPPTKEQFIKIFTERVPGYEDEILESLRNDCITYGHKQELEIVEREIEARKSVKKIEAEKPQKAKQDGRKER